MNTIVKIIIAGIICGILLLCLQVKAQETVPQTQSILKSYFVTGNRPSQTNYWELIDTIFWYVNQTYTNAVAAQQSAASVQNFYRVFATINFTAASSTNVTVTYTNSVNVANITMTGSSSSYAQNVLHASNPVYMNGYHFTVTYANPLPGTNYFVTFSAPGTLPLGNNTQQTWNTGNWQTSIGFDPPNGNATNAPSGDPVSFTTTNLTFTVYAFNINSFNGLNISVFAQ